MGTQCINTKHRFQINNLVLNPKMGTSDVLWKIKPTYLLSTSVNKEDSNSYLYKCCKPIG